MVPKNWKQSLTKPSLCGIFFFTIEEFYIEVFFRNEITQMTWMRDAETFYRERDAEIKVDVEKILLIFFNKYYRSGVLRKIYII